MNILIVAPHPDDEVLGCGGTIAKYAARGDIVSVCYVTSAYTPDWPEERLIRRKVEIQRSNMVLGIHRFFHLNYPTVKLDTIPQRDLNASLYNIVLEISPDCAFIPHRGDLNIDHRIVHDAALVALRPIMKKCRYILSYETLSETEWGPSPSSFDPRYYVNIKDTIKLKIEAMEAFDSEIKQWPHPRSKEGIFALAQKRGSEICVETAEAFMPLRIIEE